MKEFLILCIAVLLAMNSFAQEKKIAVVVDERTELITVTQLLFGYPLVGRTDIGYKKDILAAFQKYENDTTVNYLLRTTQNNFSFSKPFLFTYHFSFPGFKEKYAFTKQDLQDLDYAGRKEKLLLFNQNLQGFYTQTNFHHFFRSHQSFYTKIISPVRDSLDKYHLSSKLEAHYGKRQASYNVVLSPLSIEAGMSVWIKNKSGYDLYAIVGPQMNSRDEPVFDTRSLMQRLIIHEFSHPFCNPLIDTNYKELEKDSCLFNPVKVQLKAQGCEDWKSALKELLTRTNEILITREVLGETDAEVIYKEYMSQGWIYIQGLKPVIEKYIDNRTTYKSIDDIMPEVLLYFHNEAAKSCR